MNGNKQIAKIFGLTGLLSVLSSAAISAPLFESDETLDIVIEAPMARLHRQRHQKPGFAGTLRYTDATGTNHLLPVIVSTRGRSRLEACHFPPLKITFDQQQPAGTLFEDQRNLKLVRQCMRGYAGRDWIHLELGIYRAHSAITNYSFMTRQLNVSYLDSDSGGDAYVQPAFFLEDDQGLARRVGRERIRPPKVEPAQLAVVETSQNMLFQYLVGNTDFAVKRGPSGEGCCHNGRVFAEPGKQKDWIVVPYDFDYAGVINARYAAPSDKLPINRVTTRLYRGFCWHNDNIADAIDLFNDKRDEIKAALLPAEVSSRKLRSARRFVDRFYEIINDPQELRKRLFDKCRGPDSLPLRESPVSPGYVKTGSGS